jgi:transaldolase
MSSSLDALKSSGTLVVADTGDFESMKKYKPQDSTTNPSLILQASGLEQYKKLIDDAVAFGKSHSGDLNAKVEAAMDKVAVNFGVEILKIVPGRVSTEVDARLSFDTEATIAKARHLIELYKAAGISKERVLIKVSSTWEGIEAARQLEREGIHCNMTLLFSLVQAAACADAGVTLISPFAGRITDFYKARDKVDSYPPEKDPGVVSVRNIYNYYKANGYKTVVMGASFRSKEQVMALAGCDLLTIAPSILEGLATSNAPVPVVLKPEGAKSDTPKFVPDHKTFLWMLNEDEMASFKLAEGIRKFAQDVVKLEKDIRARITSS